MLVIALSFFKNCLSITLDWDLFIARSKISGFLRLRHNFLISVDPIRNPPRRLHQLERNSQSTKRFPRSLRGKTFAMTGVPSKKLMVICSTRYIKSRWRYYRFFKHHTMYSQTCVQRPPLGLEKSGLCSKVKAKWSLFTVYSYKISISFENLGLKLAVVDRWPLFRGGR